MDSRAKELLKQGDGLFSKKQTLNSLHQEIADHFYPQRADFTTVRTLGEEFASRLTTSYPLLAHRELASQISVMLRPNQTEWFHIGIARDEDLDNAGRAWLERQTRLMKRAMYDRAACFERATSEADADFVAFGQCALSCELDMRHNTLLYRTWHLRDLAWAEDDRGRVNNVHRNWKPSVRTMEKYFSNARDSIHQKIKERLAKDPFCESIVRHIVIEADEYHTNSAPDKKHWRSKYVSVFVDVENEHVIREVPVNNLIYVIPRWQTVSGSQYAYSPCTVAALPDARLLQAMTLVLLEAGEKAVNPPMVAINDVVRSDINIYAGGVTWLAEEYDERLGAGLRPLGQDMSGLPFGMDLRDDIKASIMEAFYLNKLTLPPAADNKNMTAFEVGQRVQEYIRSALPLFQPMESDYNGAVCEHTFEILQDAMAFGSPQDMPPSLRGQDVVFRFESPLQEAADKQKGHTFLQAKEMLAHAAELDPRVRTMIKVPEATRDVLAGIGTPAKWMNSESEMAEAAEADAARAQSSADMQDVMSGAMAAEQVGKAAQSLEAVM